MRILIQNFFFFEDIYRKLYFYERFLLFALFQEFWLKIFREFFNWNGLKSILLEIKKRRMLDLLFEIRFCVVYLWYKKEEEEEEERCHWKTMINSSHKIIPLKELWILVAKKCPSWVVNYPEIMLFKQNYASLIGNWKSLFWPGIINNNWNS